ncbi:MAG: hypothetical protein R3288_00290 [Woeseiaceae bacterium]|nr:hypothetical protein [Woeseiaceae bacterium]
MKTSKKDIVDTVGIFAVVASLIFVGMQLMLDRKVALAEQYYNRAESVKADRRTVLESDDLMRYYEEWWALGRRPHYWDEDWELARLVQEGEISVRSVLAAIADSRLAIIGYDSVYFQYQQGLLDEELWNNLRYTMKRSMARDELTRAVYERYARPTIRPVIEEVLREIESERETLTNDD